MNAGAPETLLLIPFLLASLVLAATPGPGVLYIVARTLAHGRSAGLASVLGVMLGNLGNALAAAWWCRPAAVSPDREPVSEAPSRMRNTSLPCPPTRFSKPVKRKPRPALSPASLIAWAVLLAKELWVMPLALPRTQPALVPVMLTSMLA